MNQIDALRKVSAEGLGNHILIPFRDNNLIAILESEEPEPWEFMYGARPLLDSPYNVGWFNSHVGLGRSFVRRLIHPFQKIFGSQVYLGISFEIVAENLKRFKGYQIVFCTCDPIGFAILLAKYLRIIDSEVIVIFQSLAERHRRYFAGKKFGVFLASHLLAKANHVFTLSEIARDHLIKELNVSRDRTSVFYFGADLCYWNFVPWGNERNFILCVGNDSNRDYSLLTQGLAENYRIVVISVREVPIHPNISLIKRVTNKKLRKLYQTARLVVTPTVPLQLESTGLSTTVQAMACGTPVIISRIDAIQEMFSDREEIIYCNGGDGIDLCDVTKRVWHDEELLKKISLKA